MTVQDRTAMVKALGCKLLLRRANGLSQVIDGIFENQSIEQFGAVVSQPVLHVVENQIEVSVGDEVEIAGVIYSIREPFPDGDGFVTYTLRRE